MKRRIHGVIIAICSMIFISCNSSFEGSDIFKKDFEERSELFSNTEYFSIFEEELTDPQREAMQFLYAYMPSPDITDYSGEFHLNNVNYALKARAEMPWGKNVPDREFLHFVLPPRVNNENLDECRAIFYEELKDRISNLSMYDAVLEVNHWCHEKVTYTPSDGRTSSPLATIRTAHGRCGEESTFTVAALRAVGIPARQIYTPRWAHTDSNHAWVEAWVDGKWYFFGACEPSPVLNMGWFNAPASRVLLTNTYVFGKYQGPEEVLCQDACYTEVNVTANYAPTATTKVQVVDTNGNPVNATVEFKIYNMGEFYTAVNKE
ncbi:MAG: transglutaminase domain-containing protein, partial [Muribaculaceae bacterium]|nr:transglutaminase domain-containing protein [Muribaculaceae bacterium]